jgi:RNA polymerase sigma factor for flagellar operon FliA
VQPNVEAERLFEEYYRYALGVTQNVISGLSQVGSLDIEALRSAGLVGLWKAAVRGVGGNPATFKAYAALRIRGAIYDELRRQSFFTRSELERFNRYDEHRQTIQQLRGADVAHDVIGELLSLPESEVELFKLIDTYCHGVAPEEVLPDDRPTPSAAVELSDELRSLAPYLDDLSERERYVLIQRYMHDSTFEAIANHFGVTLAAVCQMHGRILDKLRRKIRAKSVLREHEHAAASATRRAEDRARRNRRGLRDRGKRPSGQGLDASGRDAPEHIQQQLCAGDGADSAQTA